MEEIVTPSEAKIDTLLQLLAAMLDRLGGELVLSRSEFEAYEGVAVTGRNLSKDYVLFRLADEDISSEEIPILDPKDPVNFSL